MFRLSANRLAASPRLGVALRAVVAVFGGYALAAAATAMLALWLPMARPDAVITATLLSFLIFAGAVLWAFSTRSVARAWGGILVPTGLCLALFWLAGTGLGGA